MSLRGNKGVGIPTVLMHEGEGLVVTIETKAGHIHRGIMDVTQDNMNTSLKEVASTDPFGKTTRHDKVYIRGSQIVYVIFPDMLKHAPMFRRLELASQGKVVAGGLGRGRQAAITARVAKQQAEQAKEMAMKARQAGGPPGGRGGGPPGFAGPRPAGGLMPMPPGPGGPGPYGPPPGGMMPPPGHAGMMGGPPPPMGRGRGTDMTRPAWMQ